MSTKRKIHNAKFKSKIALEAFKDDKTAAELISLYKVSSDQISTWKKQLVEGAVQLFKSDQAKIIDESEAAEAIPEFEFNQTMSW